MPLLGGLIKVSTELAMLRVGDPKKFVKRGSSFRRERTICTKMCFDNLRQGFLRIINYWLGRFVLRRTTAENSFDRDFEPRRESRDIVCVGFAGSVFDT